MDKKRTTDLLSKDQFSEEDLNYLIRVVKEKPYFQAARAVLAKAARHTNHPSAKVYTNFAAVYSTDRSLLRSFFENGVAEDIKKPEKGSPSETTTSTIIKEKHLSREELEQLYQEIDTSIKEIEINKAKFLSSDITIEKPKKKKVERKKKATSESKKKETKAELNPKKKEETHHSKSDEDEVIIVEEAIQPETSENLALIDELKQKSELEVENEVTRRQIKIIDEFLSNPIELKANVDDKISEPIKDLSSTSVTAREDIVSENLAEIMLKQGKKDKAVEILKKLIWKYPKKKTYFAARIEEIKKD
ncbi:MAG: tetratricopeptide repeat protein [Bacteroidota bacterium]